ncbi:MAG: alpha-2-macroglobulin family protein, partial [Candidatus Aminicenantales bacterium]
MKKKNAYFVLLALFLGAGLFVLAGSRAAAPPAGLTPVAASQSSGSSQSGEEMSRKALDKLIGEQKFEEAAKEAARIREAAKRKGDQTVWTWALIKEAQLRTALHGYETAVRFFKDEAWPDSPADRDMLDLYYAQSLITYYQSYSWEINKRERVDAKVPVDLKSWTRDQIFGEAWASLTRVWMDRKRLADLRAKDYPDFWNPGDYPAGIRDTLRDSVVYLIAGILVDTSFWTPRQTNETYLLDLGKLLDPTFDAKATAEVLDSATAHPLEKAAALLAEHEGWSRSANRPEAALEARLVLFEALHGAFSQEDDRAVIRTRLTELLPAYRKHSWWSVGQAILAEFTREENTPDALVRARAIALKGAEAYPLSPGGKRCESIVKKIEAPEFSVKAMKNDSAGRRSVQVTHRNMGRLFFRAYPVDLVAAIKSSKDYNILPEWKETQAALDHQKPAASWKVDLPPAPDYRDHSTYAELPTGLAPGLYIVAASAREDFPRKQNRILALNVLVSDLVILNRSESGGEEVLVLSGESGRPIPGVSVDLYAYDWRKGHHVVETRPTDAQGRTHFLSRPEGGNYFLLART